MDVLAAVGLSALAHEHVYRLSGGQKRLARIGAPVDYRCADDAGECVVRK